MKDKQEIVPVEVVHMPVKQMRSPIEIASSLIEQKADPDFVSKMLELQIKFEENEAKKAYHVAMAEFKKEPIKILKDKMVGYKDKKGNIVGYSHASLGNVTESINSKLSVHGFSTSWKTKQENGQIKVTCTVTHSMGHSESTSLIAAADVSGKKNPIQAIGSTVSYLSRYTLLAITGQATFDQDDDGAGSEKKEVPKNKIISADQIIDLKDKMKDKGVTEETVLREFMKTDDRKLKYLSDLYFHQYETALSMLDKS